MEVVEGFDGLLEADGDEQAEDDGGHVDEEVAPCGDGVVGRVNVEHGELLLWSFWCVGAVGFGRGGGRDGGRDGGCREFLRLLGEVRFFRIVGGVGHGASGDSEARVPA